jgi:hypothetical protein
MYSSWYVQCINSHLYITTVASVDWNLRWIGSRSPIGCPTQYIFKPYFLMPCILKLKAHELTSRLVNVLVAYLGHEKYKVFRDVRPCSSYSSVYGFKHTIYLVPVVHLTSRESFLLRRWRFCANFPILIYAPFLNLVLMMKQNTYHPFVQHLP